MSEIEFGNLSNLHWLWLVAVVALLSAWAAVRQRRAMARFATANLRQRIFSGGRSRPWLGTLLIIATLVLLVLCTTDFRWGRVSRPVPQQGIEVMFVLDVSRSMLAQDVTPSRLQRAKQMIKDMVDEMAGDRVGLVLFAGEVQQEIPMTSHYGDFKQRLEEVGPDTIARGGSRLGDAIRGAAEGYLTKTNQHKAMVLLTDGEDMESQPIEAARQVKEEHGITIFTVGLGDLERGARIPLDEPGGRQRYLRHQGQVVWSKLEGEILAGVATATGGAYIPAGTKQVDMGQVYHGYVAGIEQQEFEVARVDSFEARFAWLLVPALALLLVQLGLRSSN